MDVNIKQPGGGGEQSPPSFKKPKFKLNKKSFLVIGIAGVVVLVVVMKVLNKQGQPQTVALSPYGSEYGSNPVQPGMGGGSGGDMQSVQDAMSAAMEKNNQAIYSTISELSNSMSSAMQNLQQQQGSSNSGAEGMVANLAGELGGILDKQQQSISGMQQMFEESLQQQNMKFSAMDQANTDMFAYFNEQIQGLMGGLKGPSSTVPGSKPTKPPLGTGTQKTSNTGMLMSGVYSSRDQANKLMDELSRIYGASDAYISSDRPGSYRVVSTFDSAERASKVGARIQERKLLSTVYTGTRADDLKAIKRPTSPAARPAAPKVQTKSAVTSSGFLQTGTFTKKADAQRVMNMINKDYGGSGTKIVQDGNKFRVQSSFANSSRSKAVLNRLQTRKVIKTGTSR